MEAGQLSTKDNSKALIAKIPFSDFGETIDPGRNTASLGLFSYGVK